MQYLDSVIICWRYSTSKQHVVSTRSLFLLSMGEQRLHWWVQRVRHSQKQLLVIDARSFQAYSISRDCKIYWRETCDLFLVIFGQKNCCPMWESAQSIVHPTPYRRVRQPLLLFITSLIILWDVERSDFSLLFSLLTLIQLAFILIAYSSHLPRCSITIIICNDRETVVQWAKHILFNTLKAVAQNWKRWIFSFRDLKNPRWVSFCGVGCDIAGVWKCTKCYEEVELQVSTGRKSLLLGSPGVKS